MSDVDDCQPNEKNKMSYSSTRFWKKGATGQHRVKPVSGWQYKADDVRYYNSRKQFDFYWGNQELRRLAIGRRLLHGDKTERKRISVLKSLERPFYLGTRPRRSTGWEKSPRNSRVITTWRTIRRSNITRKKKRNDQSETKNFNKNTRVSATSRKHVTVIWKINMVHFRINIWAHPFIFSVIITQRLLRLLPPEHCLR